MALNDQTKKIDLYKGQRMFCGGPLPPGNYGVSFNTEGEKRKMRMKLERGVVGVNWSAKNFTSLADLCTIHGRPDGNMGGLCVSGDGPTFMYQQAMHVLLFDVNIYVYCKQNCHCPKFGDNRLLNEQFEPIDRKGMTRISSLPSSSQARYEGNPRPPLTGQPMTSNQRDGTIWRGKERLGNTLVGGRWQGGVSGPAVRISGGRRPLSSTFNANGNARAVAGLGRVGMA